MCGIAGIVGKADPKAIKEMMVALRHRGPDDSGSEIFRDQRAALAHTRLSILDLSPRGHQPMTDDNRRFWITYNGEVYNFAEIRAELESDWAFRSNSDTEVILAAYRRWGSACLARFNGMYAFAIWDEETGQLFGARDRLGIKPFYYALQGQTFVFASEIKAILATGLVRPEPDLAALATPTMFQVGPRTGFKGILKLPPGCCFHYSSENGLRLERYWELQPQEVITEETQTVEQLDSLLGDAVGKQMLSDVPVGLLLSGGLDSSLVLALMAKHSDRAVKTFTIKFTKSDQRFEQMPDDSRYAAEMANRFGCDHHEIEIEPDVVNLLPKMMWHLDEPLADPAAINTFLISKAARERGVVVLLNGMGADEVFGGYRKHLACLLSESYQAWVPRPLRTVIRRILEALPAATGSRGLRTVRWAKRFISFSDLPQPARYLASSANSPSEFDRLIANGALSDITYAKCHFTSSFLEAFERAPGSYLTKMCYCDVQYYLPDHNLNYSDKCTMAAGVEGRPALIDHRVVEFMFKARPALRIKGRQQKYLLKRVAERHLPHHIVYRPKAPFGSPLRSWIRGPLAEMVRDVLSAESIRRRGLYNSDFVWEKIRNDLDGREDNAHLIWTLLCNEIWFRKFFDHH